MSEPGAATAIPVRVVGSSVPVRVTGSAVPVVVQNASPIRVVNSGPPDIIAILTVIFAFLAVVVGIIAILRSNRAIQLATLDLDATLRQARLADEDRARRPSFEATASIAGSPFSTSLSLSDPVDGVPLALRLQNLGPQRATDLALKIKSSPGLTLRNSRHGPNTKILLENEHESFMDMRPYSVASTEPLECNFWTVTAGSGQHLLSWQLSGAEGDWPCPSNAPDEQWGQIHVTIAKDITPG